MDLWITERTTNPVTQSSINSIHALDRMVKFPLLFALSFLVAMAAHAGTARFEITDEARKAMPARVHLKDSAGNALHPPKLPFWRKHFVCDGRAEIELTQGNFSYEIERGPEFSAVSGSFALADSADTNVTVTLKRLTDLTQEGWWSGELHVHRPVEDVPLLMQAEDLHVAQVITWWNETNPWKQKPPPTNVLRRFDSNRFFHMLAGEDERGGGALLYLNLTSPLEITGAKYEFPSSLKFLKEARTRPGVFVDIEKPFWWDTPLWLASGMVDTVGIAHNHMQRGGVLANEAWGRSRDMAEYPNPQGNGRYTQDIYYHILNCGLRVPPSAGSASGVLPNPVGYNRVYVQCGKELTWEKWHEGLRAGRSFVSNGPLLRCRANGEFPGHVFHGNKPIEIRFDIKLDSRDRMAALELVQNGRVERLDRTKPITVSESGWFLVRAIADVTNTFRFASTAPWYVEIGQQARPVRRESGQFFVDWCRERMAALEKAPNLTSEQRDEVLAPWREAENFWRKKVSSAGN
jgi:hypothetical protein